MTATIRPIDNDSVHRLHAGQVVLELQGAIKELVENSLDAGATSIDVRIKEHGLDSIEVVDNGSGIAEADWPYIGMKHHTSKLPSLSELANVTTFGFRGEALGSLCALCESVQIVTATRETAPMGAVINLGRDGMIVDFSGRIARPRGTTITLTGLFVPLPVRRKEFERTSKREFTKALTLLYAYALVPASVSTQDGRAGVRLKVETVAAGKAGKRYTMLATDGRGSLRSSVNAVWGTKALQGVIDVDLELEVEVDSIMARREGLTADAQTVKVTGLISSAAWGQGRSSPDRQVYYVNGRPCDLKQVGRAINEVYKSFNTHQVPLAILDFQVPPQSVDINVSPDKRTVFLHSEANLIIALKTALEQFFTPSRSAFAVEGASQTVKVIQPVQTQLHMTSHTVPDDDAGQPEDESQANGVANEEDEDENRENHESQPCNVPAEQTLASRSQDQGQGSSGRHAVSNKAPAVVDRSRPSRSSRSLVSDAEDTSMQFEEDIEIIKPPASRPHRHRTASPSSPPSPPRRAVTSTINTTTAIWSPDRKAKRTPVGSLKRTGREARSDLRRKLAGFASQNGHAAESSGSSEGEDEVEAEDDAPEERSLDFEDTMLVDETTAEQAEVDEEKSTPVGRKPIQPIFEDEQEVDQLESSPMNTHPKSSARNHRRRSRPSPDTETVPSIRDADDETAGAGPSRQPSYRDEISSTTASGELSLRFDIPRLRLRYARRSRSNISHSPVQERDAYSAMAEGGVVSAAGISNRDSAQAEEALSRVISKPDFERMEVLGQFNKGFIIARLRSTSIKGKGRQSDDLFIIDQHASDEKFNFETLQRTTVIKAQTLIRPRPLQLTAGDEIVAVENLEVLRANGFEVKVDEEKAPGRGERISLAAMPVSKETTFDFKDLEQLLHLLSDGARPAGQMVRCSKARSMFAMRACRKSVMIGKSLTKSQMVQLLKNMGTIDQPWNCPHGRPTMRHLTKIEQSPKSRGGRGRIDWSKWVTHDM